MLENIRSASYVPHAFLVVACLLLLPLAATAADRQIVSGPYSFTVKAGGENNTEVLGFDGRVDYLTQMVNLHLLGTYEWLNAGRGLGEIDNKRYGAALALSHTFPGTANIFAGTAFVNEMGENFGHAYLGAKFKVADYALLSASYGFGFGSVKEIQKITSQFVGAEAVDWLKAGVVLANSQGWKANAYYTLTDPGDLKISGVEGEISYPVLDDLIFGFRGNADLTTKTDTWRNWSAVAFLTYAIGDQKGRPIDVALEKNNPTELPRIVKKNIQQASTSTLTISPPSASVPVNLSCNSGSTTTFTASGGTPPYTWATTLANIKAINQTQAVWAPCEYNEGTGTVTVTDSQGHSATASVAITGIVPTGPTAQ